MRTEILFRLVGIELRSAPGVRSPARHPPVRLGRGGVPPRPPGAAGARWDAIYADRYAHDGDLLPLHVREPPSFMG